MIAGRRLLPGKTDRHRSHRRSSASVERSALQETSPRDRFLSVVFETIGALVVVLDRRGRIVYFNKACERITNYGFLDVMGKPIWETLIPSAETEGVKAVFGDLAIGGIPNRHVNNWVTRDGRLRLIEWSNTVLEDDAGSIEYVIGTGIDITEQRAAEEIVRDSRRKLQILLETGGNPMGLYDREGVLIMMNKAGAANLRGEPGDFIGKSLRELLPEQAGELITRIEMAFDTCEEKDYEDEVELPAGNMAFLSTYKPIADERGKIYAVQIVSVDVSERTRLLAQLRQDEEFFRRLSENISDGIVIHEGGLTLDINESFARRYGYKRDEMVGKPVLDFIHPDSHELVLQKTTEGFEGTYEFDVSRGDGSPVPMEVTVSEVPYHGRNVRVAAMKDISERKRHEEELRSSEARFRELFEKTPVAVLIEDFSVVKELLDDLEASGVEDLAAYLDSHADVVTACAGSVRIVDVNETAVELYHAREKEELVAGGLGSIFTEASYQMFKERLLSLAAGVRSFEREVIRKTLDGDVDNILLRSSLEEAYADTWSRVLVTVIDITGLKRAERELSESEEKYRTLLGTLNEGIMATDPDAVTSFVNERMAQMLGYNVDEMIGRPFYSFMDERNATIARRNFARRREGEEGTYEIEWQRKDGSKVSSLVHVAPIFNPEGEFAGAIAGVLDVTEQKVVRERQQFAVRLLDLLNTSGEGTDTIRRIVKELKEFTGIEAISVRLREGDDYPFYYNVGFPERFTQEESSLLAREEDGEVARDPWGRPTLECMCGLVIQGGVDHRLPFFTEAGSFWTNSLSELLASPQGKLLPARAPERLCWNQCESHMLVPLRSENSVLGLLALCSNRKGLFSEDDVRFIEELGESIGIALARRRAEEELLRYRGRLEELVRERTAELETANEELWTTRARFAQLLQSSPAVIYSCEPYGDFAPTYIGENVEEQTGYTADEFTGSGEFRLERIHPEDRQRVLNGLTRFLAEGLLVHSHDYRFLHKNGTYRWMHDESRLVTDENGDHVEIVGYWVDIEDRTRAEARRAAAEERIVEQSRVLSSINEVFRTAITCDTDMEVALAFLAVAQELTGSEFGFVGEISADGLYDTVALTNPGWEACDLPPEEAIMLIRGMEIRSYWGRAMKTGEPVVVNDPASDPDRRGTPEGHPEITSYLGIPLMRAGRIFGLIGLANKPGGYDEHDVEDMEALSVAFAEALTRKRAELEIVKLNEDLATRALELEAYSKEVEAFSYSVSHDLRAPLRSIDGFSLALLEDYADELDDRGKDYLNRVRAASESMAELIDDVSY